MNVKHGFSTLNRLLGKKNKGHNLSKSSTNLSTISSNHIDTTAAPLSSHLEQNRITPLPVATSNAPFEQTFRITVLLPRDQLYVARMGAKTKLEKLLELVCENKQLDPEKYEFRHPIDSSQVFNCELTIGAVGLSEIRLCHKSEAYDNFNADEIIKLRHTGRDSMSSSEFSSRNSKHTLKTASPYSSTNSLNSIDSAGMSTNYRGPMLSLSQHTHHNLHRTTSGNYNPPVAPARKKRVAPRPPSQNSIPESEIEKTINGHKEPYPQQNQHQQHHQQQQSTFPKKDFHVSSPNLTQCNELTARTTIQPTELHQSIISVDCNGNNSNSRDNNSCTTTNPSKNPSAKPNGHIYHNGNSKEMERTDSLKVHQKIRPASMHILNHSNEHFIRAPENGLATSNSSCNSNRSSQNSGSISNGVTTNGSTETIKIPEPVPRKRVVAAKKKAPAPPPRTLAPPIAQPRISATTISSSKCEEKVDSKEIMDNSIQKGNTADIIEKTNSPQNYTSEEIVKIKTETKDSTETTNSQNNIQNTSNVNAVDQMDKMCDVDSHNEPIPLKDNIQVIQDIQSNLSEEKPKLEAKQSFTSNSDDEEQINVYNLTLGKTIQKSLIEHKANKDLNTTSIPNNETNTISELVVADNSSLRSESPGWTYTIPAPPNFADAPTPPVPLDTDNQTDNSNVEIKKDSPKPISIETQKELSNTNTGASESKELSQVLETSDLPITPIITERNAVDFQVFEEFTPNAVINKTETLETNKVEALETIIKPKEMIITSDIEDGYRGGLEKNEINLNFETIPEKKGNYKKSPKIEEIPVDVNGYNHVNGYNKETPEDFEKIPTPSPHSSLEAYDNNKTELISELNSVINESKIETIIRKTDDADQVVESVKPCTLSNFKIQTYNHPSEPLKTQEEKNELPKEDKPDEVINQDNQPLAKVENEEKRIYIPQRQTSEEDKVYKKRSSLTLSNNVASQLFRSRGLITRSDSFHSTQYPNNSQTEDTLTLRSSSYASLQNAQKFNYKKPELNEQFTETQRRKSTSELSIGESPSLQSLIVMKSILNNSRKNSLNNENELQKISCRNQNGCADNKYYGNSNTKFPIVETSYECDSSKENSPKNKILSRDIVSVERTEKSNDSDKKWKYQGPPSINLSTWSERPKIQVSIKDDSDYKFGIGCGGSATSTTSICSLPRGSRNSISEVITNCNKSMVRIVSEQPKVPFVRSVEYKKSTSLTQTENDANNTNNDSPYPPVNPKPLSAGNTMTLGRIPKINRPAFAPTVKGFKNIENVDEQSKVRREVNGDHQNNPQIHINTWKMTSNKVERSNSAVGDRQSVPQVNLNVWKGLERSNSRNSVNNPPAEKNVLRLSTQNNIQPAKSEKRFSMNDVNTKIKQENSSPFSQVILRKTGLKEKIISTDEVDMPKCPSPPSQENCAKLELKITTLTPTIKRTIEPQKRPQLQQNQSNPKQSAEQQQSIPPPPPPIIRSVVTKQNPGIRTTCLMDPRDQLLCAIRNFNKDSLKRN